MRAMSEPGPLPMPPEHAEGAVSQSIRIGFRVLQVAMLALIVAWLAGNVRRVPPDKQAVVLRFGRVVAVQQSGLVVTLPRPIQEVVLLPGPTTQLDLPIDASHRAIRGMASRGVRSREAAIPPTAGAFLTGDNGVIVLDARLTWRVADAAAYLLAQDRVETGLQRVFAAAATEVAAGHELDDFLAVRPERDSDPGAQARRQAIRGELAMRINASLRGLETEGEAGLGVEVTRVDVTPLLPPAAKDAFDRVLQSTQLTEQGLATARTQALYTLQQAEQQRNRILTDARAAAGERIGVARERTAAIVSVQQRADPANRPSLLDQVYRERVAEVLRRAGTVSALDPRGGNALIIPGPTMGTPP
ncbi:MAG: protease modulator HflK [Acetobacteraceae bacterium]